MKSRFLFPHKWRVYGYLLLLIAIAIILYNYNGSGGISAQTDINGNFFSAPAPQKIAIISNDTEYISVILGLLFIGFSKEKTEDEQIVQLRLDSLQWAVYFNYALLIICIIMINGINFLNVLAYDIMSQLVFFIIRFRWKVYQLNRLARISEIRELNNI